MKKTSKKRKNQVLIRIISILSIILAVMLVCFAVLFILKSKGQGSSSKGSAGSDAAQTSVVSETASLSEKFIQYEGSENLLIFSGDELDGMSYPEFYICKAGIVMYCTDYTETEGESRVNFYLFDPETGSVTAKNSLACEFLTDIRYTDKGLMICDSSIGYAALLDENLAVSKEWTSEPNYEFWYVSSDGETLYKIDDTALYKINLESGSSEVILSSTVSLYGTTALNGGADICYVDENQMTREVWLDLETGEISSPGFDAAVSYITKSGDIWLAQISGTGSGYIAGSSSDAVYIEPEDGNLSQVQGSDYLLCRHDDNSLYLYTPNGSFVSSCAITDETAWFYSNTCAYSDVFGGYFIAAYTDDATLLFFWDTKAEAEGSDLVTVSYEQYSSVPEGSAVSASLYERAAALGEKYGVEILIADQCEAEYDDFTSEQVYDEDLISAGLDILDEALSAYPDNFIEQIKYDQISGIQINLMGTLTPVNSVWGEEGYNALTEEDGNRIVMVYDLNQMYTDTVYHEMSHAIDKKLEWDSYCRTDALYSEDGWAALNPEGFEYDYVYNGFLEAEFEGDEYLYFIDTYSMVSPTEDRARIMEYAMAGYDYYFTGFEPTAAKLSYYSECIRDAFDSEGWPDILPWEEPLN